MATETLKLKKEEVSFTHVFQICNLNKIYSELEKLEKDITGSGITKIMTHFRKIAVNKSKGKKILPSDYDVLVKFIEERETSFNNTEFIQTCVMIPEIKHQVINAMLKILEGPHLVKFMNRIEDEFDEEGQYLLVSADNDKAKSIYINRYQFSPWIEADFLCSANEKLAQEYLDLYTIDIANKEIIRDMGILV